MIQDRVRLPRKLSKTVSSGVIAEAGRLHPVGSLNITLNMLPLSRVAMTLAESDLDLAMHDFVEVYNQNGSVGVYRVSKITNTYRKERKIELSHGLDVFSDAHFAVIEDYSGTVAGFLARIIAAQTQMIGGVKCWQLGTCADTNAWSKEIRYDNLMTCLTDIAKKEEDYMFTFDQSTFPWTLNFVRREDAFASEFRLRRNTSSCSVAVDDADLCTRLYVSATDDSDDESSSGGISEGYYTFNDTAAQAVYGIVAKTVGVNTNDFASAAALEAWAADYFSRHNSPTVQISIDGMELNRLTGESIDEMHIGKMCRVALPEYDTVFNERIVSVTYTDALRLPTSISVSLANKRETAEDAFATISNTASSASAAASSARSSSKSAKKKVGEIITQLDEMEEEIYSSVYSANSEIYSYIRMTATNIRSEVANTASALGSSIEQTSESIKSEVHAANSAVYSFVEMTATQIRSEVGNTACGLMSAIIQTASSIRSEVSAANCAIYTYVDITASGIISRIHNQQRQIFTGPDTPGSGSGETVEEGALWIKYPQARTWEEAEDTLTWVDDPTYNWNELGGSIIYEYINGQWVEKLNEATLAEDAYVEDTAHGLHRTYAAVTIDAQKQAHAYRSEWQQTASMLWNDMEDRAQDLGSRIEQTTTQIRTEVHAAKSSLYSEIKQTATNIAQHVADEKKSIYSHIEQTASSITSTVADLERGMYSNIRQTASEIRAHVKDVKEGLESTITQTASRIEARVANAEGDISTLTVTATSISTRVSDAESNISSIVQTASEIRSDVSSLSGELASSILQTSTNIAIAVRDAKCDMQASINVQKNRIDLVVEDTSSGSKVRAAKIVESINDGASTILIDADHINIGSSSSAVKLSDKITIVDGGTQVSGVLMVKTGSNIVSVNNGKVTANNVQVSQNLIFPTSTEGTTYNLSSGTVATMIQSASVSGNTLTLTRFNGTTLSFSKATSLSGAWSSSDLGKLTVTASPQGTTYTAQVFVEANGNPTRAALGKSLLMPVKISAYMNGSETPSSTRYTSDVLVNATLLYNEGWAAAYGKVTLPTAGSSSTIVVKTPPSTVDGNATSTTYTLRSTQNDAYISIYSGENVTNYAHIAHNQYSAGESSVTVSISRNGGTFTASGSNGASDSYTLGTYNFTKAYDTRDNVYYGKLYDSNGNALTSSSYYWYGLGSNEGTGTSVAFYR